MDQARRMPSCPSSGVHQRTSGRMMGAGSSPPRSRSAGGRSAWRLYNTPDSQFAGEPHFRHAAFAMTPLRTIATIMLFGLGLLAWCYWTAVSDPVVRVAELELLPTAGETNELRVLLISDIHVAGPDMSPSRLRQIVRQANKLRPDLILIAGDLVSDKRVSTRTYSLTDAVAPLRELKGRLGVFAVLGNHDHWRNAAAAGLALKDAGIHMLDNSAARAGPLVVGGLDDPFTRHDDLQATLQAMRELGGVPILLSHSPDPFPAVPTDVELMVAGHTHCGQIRLPLIGALSYMSEHGDRYACGLIRESGKVLVVSAGLGTSLLPLRLGAVPDMWLLHLKVRRPAATKSRASAVGRKQPFAQRLNQPETRPISSSNRQLGS